VRSLANVVPMLIAASLVLAVGRSARAEDSGERPGPGSSVVMLAERHVAGDTGAVIRAVQGQLSDLSVALQVVWTDALAGVLPDQIARAEEIARGGDTLAVFWCDLAQPDRIYLYFAAPSGGRVLVRELSGAAGGGLAEALALIVRSSVEAVIAGGEIGVVVAPPPREAETERAPPAPPAVPPPGPGRVLALQVAYDLDVLSTQQPAAHALALGLELRVGGPLSVELGYLFALPVAQEAHGVELTLRRHPGWAGLRAAWLTGQVSLSASVWLQLDVVTERVRALRPGVAADGDGTEVIPSLAPILRAGYLFSDRFELFLAGGADVPLRRVRYVIGTPSGPLELLDTWPVRPRVMAGLSVGLW
jgi:hypothetical protein